MVISTDDECFYVAVSRAKVTADALMVDLEDGRQISVPLVWHPRLLHGTVKEREKFEISNSSLHWPELDEDISVKGMLLGRRSGESQASLNRWLKAKNLGKALKSPHRELPDWAKVELKNDASRPTLKSKRRVRSSK